MRYLQDMGLLLTYCLFSVQHTDIHFTFILAFLCTLILASVHYLTVSPGLHRASALIFLGAALFFPPFFFFFPIIVYLLFRTQLCWGGAAAILLYVCHFALLSPADYSSLFFGLFGFLLASLLQYRTGQDEILSQYFRRMRDDSEERNLLLTEKNRNLTEKQNYEIYTATLKERNRIAREIHDNVGHILSRSILMIGAAKAVNQDDSMESLLENIDTSLNAAMDSIRNSVHDLHDESLNLEETLRSIVQDFSFCTATLDYDMGMDIPRDIKYTFISITKEALSNIMKHSNATRVSVLMREHPAIFQLCIEDNGSSEPSPCSDKITGGRGMGLQNMAERVYALKGNFQLNREKGFKIFISIPKE